MKPNSRVFHRNLALWIALPLLISIITGLIYRVGRSWFGMTKPTGSRILEFHTGEWLGENFSHAYVLYTGLGLLLIVCTGAALLLQKKSASPARRFHRWVGTILLIPLFATATTGIAYHFGEKVLGFPEPVQNLLMDIHQVSWLGSQVRPFYILLLGFGLFYLIYTGLIFVFKMRQPRQT